MDIVYASDDGYAHVLAASIISLMDNNKDTDGLQIHILDCGLREESKKKITQMCRSYGVSTEYVHVGNISKNINIDMNMQRWPQSALARLFMPSLLHNLDKVLYLDCDTVICGSLSELWETDLNGYHAAMVSDGHNGYLRKQMGISPDGEYFNSGMILASLERWRQSGIEKQFIEFIVSQNGYVQFADQPVINAVLDGRIRALSLKYNVTMQYFIYTYKEFIRVKNPTCFVSEEDYREAVMSPVIIHYTGSIRVRGRPWLIGNNCPKENIFRHYYSMTLWGDEPFKPYKPTMTQRIYGGFSRLAPRLVMIWISYIGYIAILPMIYTIKRIRAGLRTNQKIRNKKDTA